MEDRDADADHLARFCAWERDLTKQASEEGWAADIDRIKRALQAGQPPADILRPLWRSLGVGVESRGQVQMNSVPGQEPVPPPSGSYMCPQRRCSRLETRRPPGGPAPWCHFFDAPLTFG